MFLLELFLRSRFRDMKHNCSFQTGLFHALIQTIDIAHQLGMEKNETLFHHSCMTCNRQARPNVKVSNTPESPLGHHIYEVKIFVILPFETSFWWCLNPD